ncbi:beta-hydroxyacyl-ACP dehydratase [Opitutia bacterium KCR 482]|nr:beta-hydroxyacyl-ACP dehydratase [Opitutae bacterium KCR 482]
MILGKDEVKKYLPQREPFLFVDSVESYERGKSVECRLFLDPEYPFFKGHFPDNPIMPGVLMVEAMAQSSGIIVALDAAGGAQPTEPARVFYLASNNVKFTNVVHAGETLAIRAELAKSFGALRQFSVEISSGRKVAASGTLVLAEAK